MTQDEIIEMARQAGLHIATDVKWMPIIGIEYAETFAKLVAAKEREECAKVCDDAVFKIWEYDPVYLKLISRTVCTNLAKAIRARGEQA